MAVRGSALQWASHRLGKRRSSFGFLESPPLMRGESLPIPVQRPIKAGRSRIIGQSPWGTINSITNLVESRLSKSGAIASAVGQSDGLEDSGQSDLLLPI